MDKTLGYEPRDVKVRILLESQIEYEIIFIFVVLYINKINIKL